MNEPVIIDEEFRSIIHKPTKEEFENLESLCLEHGIQDSLKTWHGILVDGHNRYEISQKWDLNYEVCEIDSPNRESVKAWIAKNQLGRRNISNLERIRLARIAKPKIVEDAEQRTAEGNAKGGKSRTNSSETLRRDYKKERENTTVYKLAKAAGVGEDTFRKGEAILDSGNKEIIDAVNSGEMSINKAFGEIKKIKKEEGEVEVKKENQELDRVEPNNKLKKCKHCGRMLPISEFYRDKDGYPSSPCKECKAEISRRKCKDVKGNVIKDTGEFSNVSDEEIIGDLYDASTIDVTITDVVQEFMTNFDAAMENLNAILKAHDYIVSNHKDEMKKMLDCVTTKIQELRKEYT